MTGVCLRCDWAGDISGDVCPNCGAPLYRKERPPERPPHREPPTRPVPAPEATAGRPVRHDHPAVALIVALVVAAGAATWFFHVFTRPPPTAGAGGGHLRGFLVYVAQEGAGARRLFTLNLATGVAATGPPVGDVRELVGSTGTYSPWVGVTTAEPSGQLHADLYRSLGPDDRPASLGQGDLLSWGPRAETLATVRRSPADHGCDRIAITSINVVSSIRERIFHRRAYCDHVLAVGRDSDIVYLLRRHEGSTGIVSVGFETLHPLLRDYSFLSISPTADMVVVSTPGAARPPGAALYWRGNSPRPPVAYRDHDVPLLAERVLAWAPDRSEALVLGSVGVRSGLYLLDASPGEGVRVPLFVGAASDPIWAAFSDDGICYVASAGSFSSVVNGALTPLQHIAPSTPPPDGPIAWIP